MTRNRVHPDSVERSVTVFGTGIVPADPLLLPCPAVLFVHNIADPGEEESSEQRGKRAGWGKPGGGQKSEEWEDPASAINREYEAETGVRVAQAIELHEFEEPRVIITPVDRISRRPIGKPRIIPFKRGERPSFSFDPKNETAIENWVHSFKVKLAWEGSALQRVLRQLKQKALATGKVDDEWFSQEGIGVYLGYLDPESEAIQALIQKGELTPERVDFLNHSRGLPTSRTGRFSKERIDEMCIARDMLTTQEQDSLGIEELHEVDRIWLFPLPYLLKELQIMQSGEPSEFYYYHLLRLERMVQSRVFPELLSD